MRDRTRQTNPHRLAYFQQLLAEHRLWDNAIIGESSMHTKSHILSALGGCALGLAATAAQAAPASGLADAVDREAARNGPVETVTWYGRRHCHWHYGYSHCWYGHRHYRPYYGYSTYRPYYGHYGYRRW